MEYFDYKPGEESSVEETLNGNLKDRKPITPTTDNEIRLVCALIERYKAKLTGPTNEKNWREVLLVAKNSKILTNIFPEIYNLTAVHCVSIIRNYLKPRKFPADMKEKTKKTVVSVLTPRSCFAPKKYKRGECNIGEETQTQSKWRRKTKPKSDKSVEFEHIKNLCDFFLLNYEDQDKSDYLTTLCETTKKSLEDLYDIYMSAQIVE